MSEPETGGDEARVREIVDRHGFAGIVDAVREALRVGRAAENEACENKLRADSRQRRIDDWEQLADELLRQADAIAARRGSK